MHIFNAMQSPLPESRFTQRKRTISTKLKTIQQVVNEVENTMLKEGRTDELRHVDRSRRNPRSRCAWLTGPEPHCGYARTSFGIDGAAEVTISKCNLWKSRTLELTSECSHAHLTIFSTVWDTCWFYQDHASRRNAKLQKIYQYFVG